MSSLMQWDSIRDATSLRDAMSQLFEQAVMRPGFGPSSGLSAGGAVGHLNVLEVKGMYLCQVLLPGVHPEDTELTVRQNTLTIKAKLPNVLSAEQQKEAIYLLREFGTGEFTRSVSFPKDVDGDAVKARYERGILTVEIPVAQHAQPKRITIHETGSTGSQLADQPFVEQDARVAQPADGQ
ncbi:MAG TPA: Hsp20/alpha crystallin family protein [Ktedonobacterales bacterium]